MHRNAWRLVEDNKIRMFEKHGLANGSNQLIGHSDSRSRSDLHWRNSYLLTRNQFARLLYPLAIDQDSALADQTIQMTARHTGAMPYQKIIYSLARIIITHLFMP
jgi:hypothetical protein